MDYHPVHNENSTSAKGKLNNNKMWRTIRKFGVKQCDLPTMLSNVSFFLRALTLNIDLRYKKRIPICFYILMTAIASCYFYVYLISMVWFVFCRCFETGDLLAGVIVFSLGLASEIGMIKFIYMFIYIDKIKQIVAEYLACDAIVVPGSRFSNNILKTLAVVKRRAVIFWIVVISNGLVYITKPILIPGRHFMEDHYIIYGLEPMYQSPNYQIAFILMSVGACFTCHLQANITTFLIVITGYTEAQMLSLSEELNHLWEDAQTFYRNKIDTPHYSIKNKIIKINDKKNTIVNKFVKRGLKDVIRRHTSQINLLNQIEYIFRDAIAIEFSLLIIGLIAGLLGGLEETYVQIPFALIQIGMDCLTGQRVMDASATFERAVYDCKWEKFDVTNMKIVLMMLQNSQKTLTLSAGGVTMLSFTCLMSVIRSIYSAYTTLRSTMK